MRIGFYEIMLIEDVLKPGWRETIQFIPLKSISQEDRRLHEELRNQALDEKAILRGEAVGDDGDGVADTLSRMHRAATKEKRLTTVPMHGGRRSENQQIQGLMTSDDDFHVARMSWSPDAGPSPIPNPDSSSSHASEMSGPASRPKRPSLPEQEFSRLSWSPDMLDEDAEAEESAKSDFQRQGSMGGSSSPKNRLVDMFKKTSDTVLGLSRTNSEIELDKARGLRLPNGATLGFAIVKDPALLPNIEAEWESRRAQSTRLMQLLDRQWCGVPSLTSP